MFSKTLATIALIPILASTALGQATGDAVPAGRSGALAADRSPASERLGVRDDLIVDNRSHQGVYVYYDGQYIGFVGSHSHRHFSIHHHSRSFNLSGRGASGGRWDSHVHGDFRTYTWTLRP